MTKNDETMMDGCGGHGYWWYSVGSTRPHDSRIPAYLWGESGNRGEGYSARRTQLFIRTSNSETDCSDAKGEENETVNDF